MKTKNQKIKDIEDALAFTSIKYHIATRKGSDFVWIYTPDDNVAVNCEAKAVEKLGYELRSVSLTSLKGYNLVMLFFKVKQ